MQFGRFFEEFEVGAVYKHWPGKTVTEYDDHLFCLLTMNHHPLHLDAHYAEETTDFGTRSFGRSGVGADTARVPGRMTDRDGMEHLLERDARTRGRRPGRRPGRAVPGTAGPSGSPGGCRSWPRR